MTNHTDAKGRWCPFARVLFSDDDGAAAFNRRGDTKSPPAAHCIGDNCMAWRRHPPTLVELLETSMAERILYAIDDDDLCRLLEPTGDPEDEGKTWIERGPRGGFCGLAGSAGAP